MNRIVIDPYHCGKYGGQYYWNCPNCHTPNTVEDMLTGEFIEHGIHRQESDCCRARYIVTFELHPNWGVKSVYAKPADD